MLTFLDVDLTPLKQVLACLPLREHDSHRAVAGGSCYLLIFDSRLLSQTVSKQPINLQLRISFDQGASSG